jgi:flagellar biosynthesis/type III secretory pathway M-ring protein FliF/YscJ
MKIYQLMWEAETLLRHWTSPLRPLLPILWYGIVAGVVLLVVDALFAPQQPQLKPRKKEEMPKHEEDGNDEEQEEEEVEEQLRGEKDDQQQQEEKAGHSFHTHLFEGLKSVPDPPAEPK